MPESTDEELVVEILDGHSEPLEELYSRYVRKIFVFCNHTLKSSPSQEVEDLVQDIFLRVIKALHSFNPSKASFRTWLYTIARNCCIDFIRRNSRFSILSLFSNETELQTGKELERILEHPGENIENRVLDAALYEALAECIHGIQNDEERQAILLYYLENKVLREIALIIDRSLSTAKNRVISAQAHVKDCLQAQGYSSWGMPVAKSVDY